MKLRSSAFENGGRIPKTYTGDGADLSPPLEWQDAPSGVKEFALICDDPDAPKSWVHWVVYGIPADVTSLAEGASQVGTVPRIEGRNSWNSGRKIGYRGPAPPPGHGLHHYRFRLYALDAALRLPPGADKDALLDAIAGHTLAKAEFVAVYDR